MYFTGIIIAVCTFLTIGIWHPIVIKTDLLLLLSGAAVTLSEPLWMRIIYRRMMQRRYDNLEGFHSTR